MVWAAYIDLLQGKEKVHQPVGPCCKACYNRATAVLGFSTFGKFEDAWNSCEEETDIKLKWSQCMAREKKPDEIPEWERRAVVARTAYDIEISRGFKGYNEKAIKSSLQLIRLTQKAVNGVQAVAVPSLDQPDTMDTYWLFSNADAPPGGEDGVDIRIKSRITLEERTPSLQENMNLYDAHAREVFGRTAVGKRGLTLRVMCLLLRYLKSFVKVLFSFNSSYPIS